MNKEAKVLGNPEQGKPIDKLLRQAMQDKEIDAIMRGEREHLPPFARIICTYPLNDAIITNVGYCISPSGSEDSGKLELASILKNKEVLNSVIYNTDFKTISSLDLVSTLDLVGARGDIHRMLDNEDKNIVEIIARPFCIIGFLDSKSRSLYDTLTAEDMCTGNNVAVIRDDAIILGSRSTIIDTIKDIEYINTFKPSK